MANQITSLISKKPREVFFDNAKFILIILVVFGHSIETLVPVNPVYRTTFMLLYTFTMPLFIFISGYFAKSRSNLEYKIITRLLVPYLIFQIIFTKIFGYLVPLGIFAIDPFRPYRHLWYLYSLIIWYVALPYINKLKYPLTVSIVLAILVGCIVGLENDMGISRTVTFLPFFLAGYYSQRSLIDRIKKMIPGYLALFIFVAVFIAYWFLGKYFATNIFYFTNSYQKDFESNLIGIVARIILLATAALLSISFIKLMPSKKTAFSHLGSRTMYVYILHLVVFEVSEHYNLFFRFFEDRFSIMSLFLFSFLLTLFLSSNFIKWIFSPFIEPKLVFLFNQKKKV